MKEFILMLCFAISWEYIESKLRNFLMERIRIKTSQNIDIEYQLASMGKRIGGYFIDAGIFTALFIVFMILFIPMYSDSGDPPVFFWVVLVLLLLSYALYDLLMELFFDGQSIGKRLLNMKVVMLDGSKPSTSSFLLRWILRLMDFTLSNGILAVVMVAVGQKGQRLGDVIGGTTVIDLNVRLKKYDEVDLPKLNPDYEIQFPEVAALSDENITQIIGFYDRSMKTSRPDLVNNLAERIKVQLGVKSDLSPKNFLRAIVKDYEHMNGDF
ncbi:RDD family protein [Chitinophagales bacterium]|nr:RDD family protein [Chitinophagales bacterium]